jgi:hypothetical protein
MNPVGIPASYTLTELGRLPTGSVSQFADISTLSAALTRSDDSWTFVAWSALADTPFRVGLCAQAPGALRIYGPVTDVMTTGTAVLAARDEVILQGGTEGCARVGEYVFYMQSTEWVCARLSAPAVELQDSSSALDLRSLRALWSSVELVESPVEGQLKQLFFDVSMEPWLIEQAVGVAESARGYSMAAAVGLVARLQLEQVGTPLSLVGLAQRRADEWFCQQNYSEIESAVLSDLPRARALLDSLDQAIEQDLNTVTAVARKFVKLRDDLESVRWLLTRQQSATAVSAKLAALDAIVADGHSRWLAVGDLSADVRIAAVSWQFPELWWSVLGL